MNPGQTRLHYLFEKYFEKTASPEERTELANFIDLEANREQVMQLFMAAWEKYQGDGEIVSAEKTGEILQHIIGKGSSQGTVIPMNPWKKFRWWRVATAAAILLLVAGGYWLTIDNKKSSGLPSIVNLPLNDINPGSYKARLTLADGRSITLDSVATGQLAQQGNTAVINKEGQLVYESNLTSSADPGPASIVYNTVVTSKGETYSLTLADGSTVWLNSASSVRFPVAFPGNERRIEVTGEVYVKVASNKAQPFIALTKGMEVMALGTEFNINAYSDEEVISTTLVEGSVKISKGDASAVLRPGQQTQLNSKGQITVAKTVNTEEITGWKNGNFHFESADLKTILRQFARWYDVEIIYERPVKNRKFFAVVKRSSTLKSVLEMLQDNDIVYRIEGKKLYVTTG